MNEYISPIEFQKFLDKQEGEREILSFLSERPQILYWTFCRAGGHRRFVLKEFPLGNQYVADFVIVNSYSGVWEVMFIELEPVNDQVFTKAGVPTKRFAGALKQIDDWVEYYEINKAQIRNDLVRWANKKDILGYDTGHSLCNNSGDYLNDPTSYLKASYHIVIGRRNKLSRESHRRKATYSTRGVEIMTYDRMQDLVDVRYVNPELWK